MRQPTREIKATSCQCTCNARSRLLLLHKLERLLARHDVDGTGLLSEANAVALLCHMQHLRSERGADELAVGGVGDGLEHLRHCRSVLRIQVGINLIEQIERRWVAGLDGEDERKSAETWRQDC